MLDKNYKKNFQGKTKELMRQMLYGWWTQKFDNAVDVYDSINVVKLERYVFDSLIGGRSQYHWNILQFNLKLRFINKQNSNGYKMP